jgi:hypothetical protein
MERRREGSDVRLAESEVARLRPKQASDDLQCALATILRHASPILHKFSFVMSTRSTHSLSPWSQYPLQAHASLPFAEPVIGALLKIAGEETDANLGFPELRELLLDGTADVRRILDKSPNLLSLRLRIPDGFNAKDSQSIVGSLRAVPGLQYLELWIWELATRRSGVTLTTHDGNTGDEPLSGGQIVRQIGHACPTLTSLNFQTRSFDYADGALGLRLIGERGFDWKVSAMRTPTSLN